MPHEYISMGSKVCYGMLQYLVRDRGDHSGCAVFDVSELASSIGVSERQARNYLQELTDKNFIEKIDRVYGSHVVYGFIYRPEFEQCLRKGAQVSKIVQPVAESSETRCQDSAKSVQPVAESSGDLNIGIKNIRPEQEEQEDSVLGEDKDFETRSTGGGRSEEQKNEFSGYLQPGEPPEGFTQNMYNQFGHCRLDKNLRSKRENQPGAAVDRLRSAQERLGEQGFQSALCNYLSSHWGDLDQKRHPLYIFLSNPERFVPAGPSRRRAGAPQSSNDNQQASKPGLLDEIMDAYPEHLIRGAHEPLVQSQLSDPAFAKDAFRILAEASRIVCDRIPNPIVWALSKKENWVKAIDGTMDGFKTGPRRLAQDPPKPASQPKPELTPRERYVDRKSRLHTRATLLQCQVDNPDWWLEFINVRNPNACGAWDQGALDWLEARLNERWQEALTYGPAPITGGIPIAFRDEINRRAREKEQKGVA
jgi:hypothetical protein